MNWGTRIVLSFAGFITVIVLLVIGSMQQSVNLVTPDYYQEELAYQERMEHIANAQALSALPNVQRKGSNTEALLVFPAEFLETSATGQVHLFRPSDHRQDVKLPLQLNAQGQQVLPLEGLAQGLWQVQLSWQANGTGYYHTLPLHL